MPAGSNEPNILHKKGIDPKILFNQKTIYEILKKNKVKSYSFLEQEIVDSAYTHLTQFCKFRLGTS